MRGLYQILLVEDDVQIREVICDYFAGQSPRQFEIEEAVDGNDGITRLEDKEYDLVLLDVMLPGMDGYELCRRLREISRVPVIFLTARGSERDRLFGYSLGCDDYMVKPFSVAELYAKAQAVLKRATGLQADATLQVGEITLNPITGQVVADGKIVELPPKQFALLRFFMENKGIVLSRDVILDRIWGYYYEGNDRVVDNHIRKLRKGLGNAGKQIRTVVTRGYRMEE